MKLSSNNVPFAIFVLLLALSIIRLATLIYYSLSGVEGHGGEIMASVLAIASILYILYLTGDEG